MAFAGKAAILAIVVGTAGVVWQVVDPPGQILPSENIANAKGGQVAGLTVVDGDYDRWYVAQVNKIRKAEDDRSLIVTYTTGRCDRDGLVGYKVLDKRIVRVTVVAGETGDNCEDVGIPHQTHVPLATPLAGRRVVPLQPRYDNDR